MHIAFDAKRAFLNNTGLGNYSRTMINALRQTYPQNSYSLYTPSEGENRLYSAPPGTNVRLPGTFFHKKFKGFWRTTGISAQLKKDGVEMYHGLSNEIPSGLGKQKISSVVTIHDLIFMRLPELYPAADRAIYRKKTRHAVKNADRIIAVSRQTGDDLIELLGADPDRVRVVGQGCNPWFYEKAGAETLERTRKKYDLPDQYLLYVGTIEERKNLLMIIRALHEHGIDIPLVAVGRKTGYFDKIRDYMNENDVKNVVFLHEIENHDLPAIYQQASIFIYPSSYEGFGIPVLEALNSGIPVITSKGGCLEETAGDGGLLVEPGNPDPLAEAIRQVLDDSTLAQSLVEQGKQHARKFRLENIIPELYNVYNECIS